MFKRYNNIKSTLKISVIGMYAALVFTVQIALMFIPNVELVTFLLSLSVLIFSLQASLIITLSFCVLQFVFHGFGTWVILYFIGWPILVLINFLLVKPAKNKYFMFVIVNTIWGLIFGWFDVFGYFIISDFDTNFIKGYFLASLPFDIIHMLGNLTISIFLFKPIYNFWNQNLKKYMI